MTFPRSVSLFEPRSEYVFRKNTCAGANTLQELFLDHIRYSPHTLLHAGKLSTFTSEKKLNNKRALSIGIEMIKDSVLSNVNGLDLTVMDIDVASLDICSQAASRLNTNVKYIHRDILESDCLDTLGGSFEVGLLIQMDYMFTDSQLSAIFRKFAEAKIENLIIFTPSVYTFYTINPMKLLDGCINLLLSLKTWINMNASLRADPEQRWTKSYRRSLGYLKHLASHYYNCNDTTDYAYPSGRITMMYLTLRKA